MTKGAISNVTGNCLQKDQIYSLRTLRTQKKYSLAVDWEISHK